MKIFYFFLSCIFLVFPWLYLNTPQDPGVVLNSQKLQCVSYTPFMGDEGPWQIQSGLKIPTERIESDLKLLSDQFSCIRIYSVSGLESLPLIAKKLGMKLLLGAWVNSDKEATEIELEKTIQIAKKYPKSILAFIVGNEALLRKEVTRTELKNYIKKVKEELPLVPITYADVWEFWITNKDLASEVDFVTIHILPYWEDDPKGIDEAINHVQFIYDKVQKIFPDKEIMIGETGWPSAGRMREGAMPSLLNQARFIRSFVNLAALKGWRYNLIEAFDQPWKRNNEGLVGGHWGLWDSKRQSKGILEGNFKSSQNWKQFYETNFAWKNTREIIQGFLYLAFSFFCYGVLLFSLDPGSKRKAGLVGAQLTVPLLITCTTIFLVIWEGLILWVDGRYRTFPSFYYLIPILLSIFVLKNFVGARHAVPLLRNIGTFTHVKKIGFSFSIIGIIVVLGSQIIEGFENTQALFWNGLCFILFLMLLKKCALPVSSLQYLVMPAVIFLLSLGIVFPIRYHLMESVKVVELCSVSFHPLCFLRSFFGILIHFRFLPHIGLLLVGIGVVAQKQGVILISVLLSGMGLVLYNAPEAAFALLVSFLALYYVSKI